MSSSRFTSFLTWNIPTMKWCGNQLDKVKGTFSLKNICPLLFLSFIFHYIFIFISFHSSITSEFEPVIMLQVVCYCRNVPETRRCGKEGNYMKDSRSCFSTLFFNSYFIPGSITVGIRRKQYEAQFYKKEHDSCLVFT